MVKVGEWKNTPGEHKIIFVHVTCFLYGFTLCGVQNLEYVLTANWNSISKNVSELKRWNSATEPDGQRLRLLSKQSEAAYSRPVSHGCREATWGSSLPENSCLSSMWASTKSRAPASPAISTTWRLQHVQGQNTFINKLFCGRTRVLSANISPCAVSEIIIISKESVVI